MRKLLFLFALMCALPILARAQGARYGDNSGVISVLTPGGPLFSVSGSTISWCNFPANSVPCTNKATTYTDITLTTPCSTSTQIVLRGTNNCVGKTDPYGNWGVWVAAGTYSYTVTLPGGGSIGPYDVTLSASGGGGGGGTPGGSNCQVQFNNAGVFGGVSDLCFSGPHGILFGPLAVIQFQAGAIVTGITNAMLPSTLTAPTTGSAGSAARWTTPRNLAGNSVDGSVDVPFANKFVIQGNADSGLPNAFSLGSLATGVPKVTTGTGALSNAAAGDIIGLWSGTADAAHALAGDGSLQVYNSMTGIGDAQGGGASGALTRVPGGITGSLYAFTHGATATARVVGLLVSQISSTPYLVKCDDTTSSFTTLDRGTVLQSVAGASVFTIPDPSDPGCGAGFSFRVAADVVLTVNRETAATFTILDGSSVLTGQTTFGMTAGEHGVFTAIDSTHILVLLTPASSAGSGTVTTSGSPASPNSACFSGSTAITNCAIATSALSDGATILWNVASQDRGTATVTLGGNRTFNVSNLVNGGYYSFAITQDGTGGRTITLGTGCTWKIVNNADGSSISLSTAAGATDYLAWGYDGTNCWAVFTPSTPVGLRKWQGCEGRGLGDGLNAIPSGTYLQTTCYNDTGSTVTITGLKCYIDGGSSSTLNAAGNTLGALLTGAVTCSTSYAAGTQGANVLLTSGDYIKFTFVADGTAKQTDWVVSGTY